MRRSTVATASLAALAVLRCASTPPWPDDWDAIGFLASMKRFDMDHFAPHAPGYPVYVALLRAASRLLRDPMLSASAVAVVSGLAAVVLLGMAARRAFGWAARRGWRAWWR